MKIAIVDERMPEGGKRTLSKDGFYVIEAAASQKLPKALASHPDMLLFYHEKTIITSASYIEEYPYIFEDITRLMPGLTLTVTSDESEMEYPHDAVFNALTIGKRLFIKSDTASKALTAYSLEHGFDIISVKQGYPACTVLPLSDNAAITADPGMAKIMSREGINVTLIENGGILLPPYEYGFIGGASGIYKSKVYFTGKLENHPSAKKIKQACENQKLTPVSLFDGALVDLGRIIFIDDGV